MRLGHGSVVGLQEGLDGLQQDRGQDLQPGCGRRAWPAVGPEAGPLALDGFQGNGVGLEADGGGWRGVLVVFGKDGVDLSGGGVDQEVRAGEAEHGEPVGGVGQGSRGFGAQRDCGQQQALELRGSPGPGVGCPWPLWEVVA